jgi:hypothetical protein
MEERGYREDGEGGGGYGYIKNWDCSSEVFSTHESVIKKNKIFQDPGSQIPKNHIFKKVYLPGSQIPKTDPKSFLIQSEPRKTPQPVLYKTNLKKWLFQQCYLYWWTGLDPWPEGRRAGTEDRGTRWQESPWKVNMIIKKNYNKIFFIWIYRIQEF